MTQHHVFCTIVPPHMLDKLARHDDHALSRPARRTLERDAVQRTRRAVNAIAGLLPSDALPEAPRMAARTVYYAERTEELPGVRMRGEGDPPSDDTTVNRAYAGLGATLGLLSEQYGRNSLDGNGHQLDATVHFGDDYANAFWDGRQMVFGDGDGEVFLDFTVAVDIIGHELIHGLVQHTANLEYVGQPGALNESISDVFGSLVKQHSYGERADEADWLIGAGLLAPRVTGRALRSLKAPGTAYDDDVLGKDPQPATMASYVHTSRDNGGVHINSGIPNRAFYLLAQALGGYAWERAGQIWYDTVTGGQLTEDAQFVDFARATLNSAIGRYGDRDEAEAVRTAWAQVGLPIRR